MGRRQRAFYAGAVATVAGILALVGAGVLGNGIAASHTRASVGQRSTVYFLVEHGSAAIGVRREIKPVGTGAAALPRGAIRALLAGLTVAERRQGLSTAFPSQTSLRSVSLRGPGNEEAIVDFTGLSSESGGLMRLQVITQVARTLIGLSGIERVRLRNNGTAWGLWTTRGTVSDRPYGYPQLIGFARVCFSAGTSQTGGCFSALP